jgi:hypothetical protein
MAVRGDRLLALKELLGNLTISGIQVKVEIVGDPTGIYIFYGSKAPRELTLVCEYWAERHWKQVIFGKEILMQSADPFDVIMARSQWNISENARKRDEVNFDNACARAKAVRKISF